MTDLELTPKEFAALLERLGDQSGAPDTYSDGRIGRYCIGIHPVMFFVNGHKWEHYKLQALLAKLSSGWKDTLTEPTLVKLRALLAADDPPPPAVASEITGA